MKFKSLQWKHEVYSDGSVKFYAEVPKDLNLYNNCLQFWLDDGFYYPIWDNTILGLKTEQEAKNLANAFYEEQMTILVEKWFDDTK